MNWIFYLILCTARGFLGEVVRFDRTCDSTAEWVLQLWPNSEYIADGRLFCNPNRPAEVILQGKIVSITEKNSTDILMMLQEWALDKPTIVVQGAQLKVDPECSVELENLGDTECRAYSAVSGVGASLPFPAFGGGVGGVLVIVVLVVIVVGILICVKKKRTNYRPSEGTEKAK